MIVSDSTALITLINIDEFRVLEMFAESIIIPDEVYDEISKKPSAKKYIDKQITQEFISVERYTDDIIFGEINYILDRGESAAITLAIETGLPLIIDEKKGRTFARKQGVEIIGLVGILRYLYVDGKFGREEIENIIQKLNNSDFRISSELLEMILE